MCVLCVCVCFRVIDVLRDSPSDLQKAQNQTEYNNYNTKECLHFIINSSPDVLLSFLTLFDRPRSTSLRRAGGTATRFRSIATAAVANRTASRRTQNGIRAPTRLEVAAAPAAQSDSYRIFWTASSLLQSVRPNCHDRRPTPVAVRLCRRSDRRRLSPKSVRHQQ